MEKAFRRLLDRKKEEKGRQKSCLKKLWPMMAGHKPLTGDEGHRRLDGKHHPGSVAQDLAGVQASQKRRSLSPSH